MTSQASDQLPPELAQIHAEAAALDPVPTDPAALPGEIAPPVDYLTDARGVADIAAESLGALYPSTVNVLTEEKRAKFAAALAPVMEKYGLTLGVVFGRWGAEIQLIFVTATFAVPLTKAIQADRAAERAAAKQAEIVSKPADPQPPRPVNDPYSSAFPENGQN